MQNALERQAAGTSEDGDEEEIPLQARVFVNLGVAYEAQDKLAEAINAYQKAIELHLDYPAALKLLGCVRRPYQRAYPTLLFRSVTDLRSPENK
jgi:tetratricopeptide (TPR) repeat protein